MSEEGTQAAVVAAIEWSDGMSVSVGEIDQQHKQLVKAINELNRRLQDGSPQEELKETIEELVRIASDHIRSEEALMQKFHFPGYKDHHLRHVEIAAKLHELRAYAGQAGALTREVPAFLMDWLSNHIRDVDRRYTACFNTNGVR
jgi:hemerythrin